METKGKLHQRVIVVSNRLPFTLKRSGDGWRTEKSAGGLATAMRPILRQTDGLWIGWSGETSGINDEKKQRTLKKWAEQERYIAVDLPPDVARGFYEGYSNQTLWPLFHHFPSLLHFNPDDWKAYVKANRIFCETIVTHLRPDDLVWIHDYQLMLLPGFLRESAPQARIGFFLHIPFPSSAVFRIIPRREELLQGLLGADYLAFQTYRYLQHFRSSILRVLGVSSRLDRVDTGGRAVRLEALPIGIAPSEFTERLEKDSETKVRLAEIRERFRDCRIILAVDRLDYTKGIPERLRAFCRLLDSAPDLRRRVVLIQVAVPSRERIPKYAELRHEVDNLVGRINGEHGTPDWTPIIYLRRNLPRSELVALYAAADVAWVTPLRDGLNLVAKEYVACKPDGDGVLVLSEFAGAAAEMGEALLVNPYDEERTAETIARALGLEPEERRSRMLALYKRVTRNDVFAWGGRFIANLQHAVAARAERAFELPQDLPVEKTVAAFKAARRRLLMLDYDGTLAPYAARPQDALPSPDLLETLERLALDPATLVAIVSGRSRLDLESWFGNLRGLWLAAEHGASLRAPETAKWESYIPNDSGEWKKKIYPILDHFVERTPGSLIEEKEFGLVWHYRMADPEFGEWLANELVANLEQLLAETHLRAVRGQKTVEVRPVLANKGEVLVRLTEIFPDPDFVLAAGDDVTDDDLFARLTDSAWSIHVGANRSKARFRLSRPGELVNLLKLFAGTGHESKAAVSRLATDG
jgi:trehalose 6-phosphate synthase/phosphatase